MAEQYFSSIKEVLALVLLGVAVILLQRLQDWIRQRLKKEIVPKSTRKDLEVQRLLIELRVALGANRSYLTMFHNGNVFLNKLEDLKETRTHETVNFGISYEAEQWRDLRNSLVPEEIALVIDNQPLKKVEALPEVKFKHMLQSQNVESIIRYPIYNGKQLVGHIGLDFEQLPDAQTVETVQLYAGFIELALARGG